jgi:hypothetical protein
VVTADSLDKAIGNGELNGTNKTWFNSKLNRRVIGSVAQVCEERPLAGVRA